MVQIGVAGALLRIAVRMHSAWCVRCSRSTRIYIYIYIFGSAEKQTEAGPKITGSRVSPPLRSHELHSLLTRSERASWVKLNYLPNINCLTAITR